MIRKRVLLAMLVAILCVIPSASIASAWEPISDRIDPDPRKFVLATFYVPSKGAVPRTRPIGPYKQLGVSCISGVLYASLLSVDRSGNFSEIGRPRSISIKMDKKPREYNFSVNTNEGPDYVLLDNAPGLIRLLLLANTIEVRISKGSGNYRAVFDVRSLETYSKSFEKAGCRI